MEVSEAFLRGKLIAYASRKKKENLCKIQELEKEIKLKENNLAKHYDDLLTKTFVGLNFSYMKIKTKSGLFQGCSRRALLFIIFIKTLAVSIMINKDIKGLNKVT